jgi:hypothetical protein
VKTLTIDPEFAALCPRPTEEEEANLTAKLQAEGCTEPLALWSQAPQPIIDGHTRYRICGKLGIAFETRTVDLPDRAAVVDWVIVNQLGRRNLTDEGKSYLRGKRYLLEKKAHGGDRKSEETKSSGQNVHPFTKTAEAIAAECKVDEKTIRRDANYAEALDRIAEAVDTETKQAILSRALPVPKKTVMRLTTAEPEAVRRAVSQWKVGVGRKNGQTSPTPKPTKPRLVNLTEKRLHKIKTIARQLLELLDKPDLQISTATARAKAKELWAELGPLT